MTLEAGRALSSFRTILTYNVMATFSIIVIASVAFVAVFDPLISPYDPNAIDLTVQMSPPSFAHLFGTDIFGRDMLSRVIDASRVDMYIAIISVSAALLIGTLIGIISAYRGGLLDEVVMRFNDSVLAFPVFLIGMCLVAVLGNGVTNVIYATIIVNLPLYARLIRSKVLSEKEAQYVEAAKSYGSSNTRIMFYHILPNCLPTLVTQSTLNLGWAILNAAGLSFIGLGVQPPQSEWGYLVANGAQFIVTGEWWLSFFPGLVLVLTILSFNLLGDVLGDILKSKRGLIQQ